MRVVYDTELRSEVSLPDCGLDVYARHHSTQMLCATVATDNFIATASFIDSADGREALGADLLARTWAELRGVPVLPFPAVWTDLSGQPFVTKRRWDGTLYNAAAGGIRNQRMLDEGRPDIGIEFPGGRGTANMRRRLVAALGNEYVLRVGR